MIFLDSSDLDKVQYFLRLGIIRGVTTNPTIMKKDGIGNVVENISMIAQMMNEQPVSVELTTNENPIDMIVEAKMYHDLSNNINIKVPIHGPNGETWNLELIHKLAEKHRIPVNATACMNAQQAYLASQAGATYVSLFGGRIADMGHNVYDEIIQFKTMKPYAQLILGSVREVSNVVSWLATGADIVTVPPDILEKMIYHPRTAETVRQFLEDAK